MSLEDHVVIRVVLTLASGATVEREWTWRDIQEAAERMAAEGTATAGDGAAAVLPAFLSTAPPAWIEHPSRRWEHPRDPILLAGVVRAGHEGDAREALGL